eukprot:TRINITY_DN3751_c3_g1_i1.p1 TRINITY_DN3751_c3_g1~~TRINITY_DN3751_c3_g1_i1.p1  ORF type:complete len:372 (+),score=61.11 TRINITY_DN3751_c3_g1_i1:104-1219(+)
MGDLSVQEKAQIARRLAVARNEVAELESALHKGDRSGGHRRWKVGDVFRLKQKIYFGSDGKEVLEGDTGVITRPPEQEDSIGVGVTTHPTEASRCVSFDLTEEDAEYVNIVRKKIPLPEKGLGIHYKTVGRTLKVMDVADGSPGQQAGVKPGTTIVFLNDTSVYSGQDYKEVYNRIHSTSERDFIVIGIEGEPSHKKHESKKEAINSVPQWKGEKRRTPSPAREPHMNPETGSTSSHGDDVDPVILRGILKRNSKVPADRSHTPAPANGNVISDFSEPDSNDLAIRVINYIYNDMKRTRHYDAQFSTPQRFRPLPSEQLGILRPPSPYSDYRNEPVFDYTPPPLSSRRWSPPSRSPLPQSAYAPYLPIDML